MAAKRCRCLYWSVHRAASHHYLGGMLLLSIHECSSLSRHLTINSSIRRMIAVGESEKIIGQITDEDLEGIPFLRKLFHPTIWELTRDFNSAILAFVDFSSRA